MSEETFDDVAASLLALDAERQVGNNPTSWADEPKKEKIGPQMAFWPEDVSAMPTELTRTALFRLIRRGRRRLMDDEKLDSRIDVEVLFSGEELDQADADLWLACLRLGRGVPVGQRIYTIRAAMLKEIKRTDTGSNRAWLTASLDRLKKASLKCTMRRDGKTTVISTRMLDWGLIEETGQMFVRLDPGGFNLFENLAYFDWKKRLALKLDATKALQIYACGHQKGKPHSVRLSDLAAWAGYRGRTRQFRRECVIPALAELEAVGFLKNGKVATGPKGEIVSWVRT